MKLGWRRNLAKMSRPDAALRLAELILSEADGTDPTRKKIKLFAPVKDLRPVAPTPGVTGAARDAADAIFTFIPSYSDGKLARARTQPARGSWLASYCVCVAAALPAGHVLWQ